LHKSTINLKKKGGGLYQNSDLVTTFWSLPVWSEFVSTLAIQI